MFNNRLLPSTAFKKMLLLVVALISVTMAGCKTVPINDVADAPVPSDKLSSNQVAKAIKVAGVSLGWNMRDTGPGMMEGTLIMKTRIAKVNISYSSRSYSIHYKDSEELGYDAGAGTIDNNYNRWVQYLNRSILTRLTAM